MSRVISDIRFSAAPNQFFEQASDRTTPSRKREKSLFPRFVGAMRTISFGNPHHHHQHPSREISLHPYLPGRSECNIHSAWMYLCVCGHVYALSNHTSARNSAELSLIDVTITAIYPDSGLFLCDTRTATPVLRKESWRRRRQGMGKERRGLSGMRPSKWMPPMARRCNNGEI